MRLAGRRRRYRARRQAFGPVGRVLEAMWDDALYTLTLIAELEESRRGDRFLFTIPCHPGPLAGASVVVSAASVAVEVK